MRVLRGLTAGRGHVVLSIATLTLAVGANLLVFGIVNALWLRPRPFPEANRVVAILEAADTGASSRTTESHFFAELGLEERLRSKRAFAIVAGQVATGGYMADQRSRLRLDGVTGDAETMAVTWQYFSVLGLGIRGRDFAPADDRPGAPPVAIISDALWRSAFARRPDIVGAIVPALPFPIQIIGIAPAGFGGARVGERTSIWLPRSLVPRVSSRATEPSMLALARLRPGVTPAQAEASLDRDDRLRFVVVPIERVFGSSEHRTVVIREGTLLSIASVMAALVLLAGCATLVALAAVHYERRRTELAIRVALGATRGRLARSLAAELALIGLAGGIAAVLLAVLGLAALPALSLPGGIDLSRLDLAIDWRVFVAGLAAAWLSLAAAAFFPLARATRGDLASSLIVATSRTTAAGSALRRWSLAIHVAATIVVLVAAGLFVRTVRHGFAMGAGFDADRTVFAAVQVLPTSSTAGQAESRRALRSEAAHRLLDGLRAVPGVVQVALGEPPMGPDPAVRAEIPRIFTTSAARQELSAGLHTVGAGYFDTLGIRLLQGRALTGVDYRSSGERPVVVTASLAAALWPHAPAMGERFTIGDDTRAVVVGVARDFTQGSPQLDQQRGVFFAATAAPGSAAPMVPVAIRASDRVDHVAARVADAIARMFPDASRREVVTGEDLLTRGLGRERLGAWFFSLCALVALGLGLGGVFGLVAYLAESRRRELGVRMALGATPAGLMRMAVGTGLTPVVAGTVAGLTVSALLAGGIDVYLIGVSRLDAFTYATAGALTIGSAASAGLIASLRIRRLSPMDALRVE